MATSKERTYTFYGYIKEADEQRYVGVCLTLNLVVEAPSQRQALDKLQTLIEAYFEDAAEQNELDKFMPRRAPFSFYAEYWAFRVRGWTHAMPKPFFTFSEARRIPLHA
jgi:hypothetical protein